MIRNRNSSSDSSSNTNNINSNSDSNNNHSKYGSLLFETGSLVLCLVLLLLLLLLVFVLLISLLVPPVSLTRFPLSRFSPGAGLLRNPFVHRQWLRFPRGWVRKDGNLLTETGCKLLCMYPYLCVSFYVCILIYVLASMYVSLFLC